MFLADAVAAYVEGLTEREFDAPLLALLRRLGFQHVHVVHGAYEFGRDFVARRHEDGVEYQYCLQSKAGDLASAGWRDVRQQVDAMRSGSVVHPDFDPSLRRRLVVVTNGRLKGGAGVEFQDYNRYHQDREEVPTELWDIDWLVPQFEAVLVEGVPAKDRARTLEMLGRLGQGAGSRLDLREYARAWFQPVLGPAQRWGNVLTGAMLAKEAAAHGREDLAAQVAFLLLRAAWENPPEADRPDRTELAVARRLFSAHAAEFWEAVKTEDPLDLTTRSKTGLDAFVTHPVRAARLCEQLCLLGVLAHTERKTALAEEIAAYVEAFLGVSPGAAHPVSDEWAFSLLVTVVLLALTDHRDTARSALRTAAVWLLDRVEHGSGIVRAGEPASAAVRQLLGPAYPHFKLGHEPAAYAFTVVLDLAHLCGFEDLYSDLLSDLDAVGAMASIIVERSPDNAELVARLAYSTEVVPVAVHHGIPAESTPPGAAGALFDCIGAWATTRDRHLPTVLAALLPAAPSVTTGPTLT